ncbi:MAG: HAMP domain-containing protein [Pseudomonadales bacterium]|nr:HAMP domain-containing protein [Pseudomonadales bacterium]MCP5216150.1 HAMP domain-containing protein [Pseudomonadales bacterium]
MPYKLKLNTIFWKIFLSIWAAMILIMVATTFTVSLLLDRDHVNVRRELSDKHQAAVAVTLFETQGTEGFRGWLMQHHNRHINSTFLINAHRQDVLGRVLPQQIESELKVQEERFELVMGRHRAVVQPVSGNNGAQFWFVRIARNYKPGFGPGVWRFGPPPFSGVLLAVSLAVTGLISLWMARNITSPIRQLQTATQQIAKGDLSARVEPKVTARRDELGDLGREFDRMAEHIEELVSAQKRMLRDVSHELRSPLARLLVALELARKSDGDRGKLDHDRIEKEANRLDELIGQVLSLVRLTTNGANVNKERVDIQGLLQQVVEDANYEAEPQNKGVVLTASVPFTMIANAELIHSALENIVRNAMRYSPEKSNVEVTSEAQGKDLKISVRDFGAGVSKSALLQIFEPFYREAEARDRASGGYGLGLAIAQRAIKLHGGEIFAHNAPEGGLIMEMILPGENSTLQS